MPKVFACSKTLLLQQKIAFFTPTILATVHLPPMISQTTIQQILNRIDIIEVVGSYVKLKKRGTNYLGLCPFHNERTPSFTVSPAKEIYKCFGCGKSGSTIGFLMELEKFSYVEALRFLAQKYNVEIEETQVSPEQKLQLQTADSLYIINNFAQKFFNDYLLQTEAGRDIGLSYLLQRGFNEATIKKFGLGLNPEARDEFARAAVANQYSIELLQKAGLINLRDGNPADNYRGRIIFPIHNINGKIIGFGARLIKNNDRAPKYINTPENEIYVKSKILYGMYQARQAIDKADECLLVEGYTDVTALHQAGIENVVASGGTSLTQDQLRLVKKYTNNLTIIYDGDGAGVKAALRGMDMALEESLNVKLVLIPDKEDPDSYVNKVGTAAFNDFVASNKKDFILFQLAVSLQDAAGDSAKKSALVNQVAETISKINKAEDFTKQQDYIKQCAALLKIDENGLNTLVNKFIRERISKEEYKQERNQPAAQTLPDDFLPAEPPVADENLLLLNKDEKHERGFARCLLEYGLMPYSPNKTVADYIIGEVEANEYEQIIDNSALLNIYRIYKHLYLQGSEPDTKTFLYYPDEAVSNLVVELLVFNYELSQNWKEFLDGKLPTKEDLYLEDVNSTMLYFKLRKIKRLMDEMQQELEKTTVPEEQMLMLQMSMHLKKEEMELTRKLGAVIYK
jgi:DNA primase